MSVHEVLQFIEKETGGERFQSNRFFYGFESPSSVSYDDRDDLIPEEHGEDIKHKNSINLTGKRIADKALFKYFLDGSRRIFKIDDIGYNNKVYPLLAGQIGVGCCKREEGQLKKCHFDPLIVLSLPDQACSGSEHDLFFNHLRGKINSLPSLVKRGIQINQLLYYSTSIQEHESYENKAIARIQDAMIEREKRVVQELVRNKKEKFNEQRYLMKDGSLDYQDTKGDFKKLSEYKSNYERVIGVSKSFNPENFIDNRKKRRAGDIARLDLHHRTPAYRYASSRSGVPFIIWYLRIRDRKYSESPFAGVIKVEKILLDGEAVMSSELIDTISKHLITESLPSCYGADPRWANHLYPIYVTEMYIKSRYINNVFFINIF